MPHSSSQRAQTLLHGDLAAAQESLATIADWQELASVLDAAIDHASPSAVRSYLREWQVAVRNLVDAAGVADDPRWETLLTDASVDAPLSPWLEERDAGEGLSLTLLAQLRASVPGAHPLSVPAVKGSVDAARHLADRPLLPARGVYFTRRSAGGFAKTTKGAASDVDAVVRESVSMLLFRRFVLRMLADLEQPTDLDRIRLTFGVSKVELAGLFGVSRQALSQWLDSGAVPPERAEKVGAVAALAALLARNLKAERIPGSVRRPAHAYGGMTMLDLIRADRHAELLELTRATFDWSVTA